MFEVILSKLTHEMESAVVVEWLKAEGDLLEKGEPLLRVETDKATVDMEADADGRLAGICVDAGSEVPVGTRLAFLLADGEELPADWNAQQAGAGAQASAATATVPGPSLRKPSPLRPPDPASRPSPGGDDSPWAGGRIVATPSARRFSRAHRIDLASVAGSGPGGRIVEADVQAHLSLLETTARLERTEVLRLDPAGGAVGGEAAPGPYEVLELTSIERRTGERLQASVREAPFFDLEVDIDMSAAARQRQETSGLSYTAILLRAVARALVDVPRLNAHFVGGELRLFSRVDLGVAVATNAGLYVPSIHDAGNKDVAGFEAALSSFREKAKLGRFAPEDLAPATFTVSNLGMYGVDRFRAVINPPQVGILAIGRIADRPVAENGVVVIRPLSSVTLTVDHRAADGALAAPFLKQLRSHLEG